MSENQYIPISYTALTKAEDCPRHWYSVYREKKSDSGTKSTFKGQEAHEAIRAQVMSFIRGTGDPPDGVAGELVAALKQAGATMQPEKWLSVDRALNHVPFGQTPWLRAIVDLFASRNESAWIIDWKTGKWTPNTDADVDMTQLQISTLAAFSKPRVYEVRPMLVYTSKNLVFPTHSVRYTRRDIDPETRSPEFVRLFDRLAAYERMQERQHVSEFPAFPCRHCNYCRVVSCDHHPAN